VLELASASAAVASSSRVELSSRASCLAWLRLCGVRAPLAVRITHGASDAAAIASIEALVAQLSMDDRRHGGLRAQPDRMLAGSGCSHQDGLHSREDDDSALLDGPGAIRLACPHWLSSALAATRRIMNSGGGDDVCLRHEPGNGRIGLMLRRCPPLTAAVRFSATTAATSASEGLACLSLRLSGDEPTQASAGDAGEAAALNFCDATSHSASAVFNGAQSRADTAFTFAVPALGPKTLDGQTAHTVPAGDTLLGLNAAVGPLAIEGLLVARGWAVRLQGCPDAQVDGEGCNAAGRKETGAGVAELGQLLWRLSKIYCSELPPPAPSHGVRCLPCRDSPAAPPPAGSAPDTATTPHRYSLYDAFAEDPDTWRKVCWSKADAGALHHAASAAAAAMARAVSAHSGAGLHWHALAAQSGCEAGGRGGGRGDAGLVIYVELELCFGRHRAGEVEAASCEWVVSPGGSSTGSDLVDVQVVGVAFGRDAADLL
jgi:hypothetical protein